MTYPIAFMAFYGWWSTGNWNFEIWIDMEAQGPNKPDLMNNQAIVSYHLPPVISGRGMSSATSHKSVHQLGMELGRST